MTAIDKNFVKQQFNKRLNTYDNEASVQKQMANKLIKELSLVTQSPFTNLFEIGSGTGFLTQQILEQFNFDHLITNDIAPNSKLKIQELESVYKKPITFIEGDVECIEFPKNLDVVISNATFQWLENMSIFFNKVNHNLNPNGLLAFSTFGCDNFKEIKHLTGIGLDYLSKDELINLLSDKFNILFSEEWQDEKIFNSPNDVIIHIKKTGVNGINKNPLTKTQLATFEKDYKTYYSNKKQEVTLTYNPILIIAQKK